MNTCCLQSSMVKCSRVAVIGNVPIFTFTTDIKDQLRQQSGCLMHSIDVFRMTLLKAELTYCSLKS